MKDSKAPTVLSLASR